MGLQYQLNSSTINIPQSLTTRLSPKKKSRRQLLRKPRKQRRKQKKRPKNKFCISMRSTPMGQIQNIMVLLSSLQQKNIRISEDKNRKSTNSFYPKKPITINNLQKCADDNTTISFGSIKN